MTPNPKRHLFVLGFSNDESGVLSEAMRERVAMAARLYRADPGLKVIVTGGHGDNFNRAPLAHRHYANLALARRGVPAESLEHDGFLSANTVEDAMMIVAFATRRALASFEVVTSAFHLARCGLIFGCVAPEHDVIFHAAQDPPDVAALERHEERARAILRAQGGVIWNSRLFGLPER